MKTRHHRKPPAPDTTTSTCDLKSVDRSPASTIPIDLIVAAQRKAARLIELAQRPSLTIEEAAELGYGSPRTLREMMSKGVLKRCVLPVGKRGKRLLQTVMIDELQQRQ